MSHLLRRGDEMDVKGLSVVKVLKKDLLEKIRDSRSKHAHEYKTAMDGWRKAVIKALQGALNQAKKGTEYNTQFDLPEPQNHTKDYDRVISMLEMSQDETLELPASEFSQYALDDWAWKRDFNNAVNAYSVQAARVR